MKQANEWEVGDFVASNSGDGLVPLAVVEREVEESVFKAGAKLFRVWVCAENSEAGPWVMVRPRPKWVSELPIDRQPPPAGGCRASRAGDVPRQSPMGAFTNERSALSMPEGCT